MELEKPLLVAWETKELQCSYYDMLIIYDIVLKMAGWPVVVRIWWF